jgi:hypothetical protein
MRPGRALRWWARRWAFTATQLGLSALAWVYVLLFVASMLLMVLIVGLLTARIVLPLARILANVSLRTAAWSRGRGETVRIAAAPPGKGLAVVVTALVRSSETWRSVLYLLVNAVSLPVHAVALVVFPLAGQWGRLDAWLTVRLLAPSSAAPSPDAVRSDPAAASPGAPGGFGLAGMAERVAALGGQLSAGPVAAGGFEVRAVLPLQGTSAPADRDKTGPADRGKTEPVDPDKTAPVDPATGALEEKAT